VDILEEGDQAYEVLVLGLALPRVEDNGVFGLLADMRGLCVDNDDLGEVTVEVREVLRRSVWTSRIRAKERKGYQP